MFRGSPWRILGLGSWGYWAGGVGVSVYRCIAALLRRSLPGPPWIGVSVYYRNPAPFAPNAPWIGVSVIGVLPQSCADRSQGSLDRCIGVSVYYRSPAPIAPRAALDRCIGVSVYYRNPAPFAPNAPWIGVSVYQCITAVRRRSLPGPPWIGVSVYRCITAVRRRSLPGPPWIGVSVYRCMGRGDRCIGVFQFSCPLLRSH